MYVFNVFRLRPSFGFEKTPNPPTKEELMESLRKALDLANYDAAPPPPPWRPKTALLDALARPWYK